MVAHKQSLMPEGIDKALGAQKMRDLMTFLLTEPVAAAPLQREGAPPPRRRAEVAAVWKSVKVPAGRGKRLRVLLAAGPKDHGPGEHDYPLWQRRWFNLLSLADNVHVEHLPDGIRIDVRYFVRVSLPGYTVDLHFYPGAGSR